MEEYPAKELVARALLRVGLNLRSFQEPLRLNTATVLEAHRLGMLTGDVETAMYAATAACGVRFYSGEPLPLVAKATRDMIQQCEEYRQHAGVLALPLLQCCLNLMGRAAGDPLVLTGEAMNEEKMLRRARAEHNTGLLSFLLTMKYIVAIYLKEHEAAESVNKHLRRIINKKHPPFLPVTWTFHHFFEGIAAVASARKNQPLLSRTHQMRVARRRLQQIAEAGSQCPENMMNKVHLLDADLQACRGNFDQAESKYRQSIVFAEHEGFLPEQALACEQLADLHLQQNTSNSARKAESRLQQARAIFTKYGARLLVDQIDEKLGSLRLKPEIVVPAKGSKRWSKTDFNYGCFVPKLVDDDFQFVSCR